MDEDDIYEGPVTEEPDAESAEDEFLEGEPTEDSIEEPAEDDPVSPELDPEFVAWIKDKDPSAVRKSFEKFTQEWESLAPYRRLKQEMDNDAGLLRAIERYYTDGPGEDEGEPDKIAAVEERVNRMANELRIEKELQALSGEVSEKGYPEFDATELLKHAAEHRLPNLRAAYRDKYADDIAEARVKAHEASIKANAKAKVTTRPKAAPAVTGTTLEDLEGMSDAQFLEYVANKNRK